ncbi:MAG: hypothetical protein IT434_16100, partial [Phycisphaerales bacterium]|nr:hypothetical protein [Phycisphaerales bacterium]
MSETTAKENWKTRLIREFRGYWLIVAYLAIVFAAFTQYRRLVLAAHDIVYTDYFIALIKAMVLAKVIMIGDALRIGRGLERRPLIWRTLYNTAVFTVFLVLFTLVEHGVKSAWKGEGFGAGVREFAHEGRDEALAGVLVIAVGLVPFFAFREIGGIMARGKLLRMFFVSREG